MKHGACNTFMDSLLGLLAMEGYRNYEKIADIVGRPASKAKSKPTGEMVSPLGALGGLPKGVAGVGGAAGFIPNS